MPIPPFFVLYFALAVAGGLYFNFGRDGRAKRRIFPAYMAVCAAVFVALAFGVTARGGDAMRPWPLLPFVAIVYVVTVRTTTFCTACGRTIRGGILRRPVACPACGAPVTSDDGAAASSSSDGSPASPLRALFGWRGALLLVAFVVATFHDAIRRALTTGPTVATAAAPASDAGAVAPPPAVDSALDTTRTFVVERPVLTEPGNPAPAYPPELRMRGVEGETLLQFVVDTTGRARMSSVRVLRASDSAFARAVIAVLPQYRFIAATSHDRRVAQIVQLPFEFRLAR